MYVYMYIDTNLIHRYRNHGSDETCRTLELGLSRAGPTKKDSRNQRSRKAVKLTGIQTSNQDARYSQFSTPLLSGLLRWVTWLRRGRLLRLEP